MVRPRTRKPSRMQRRRARMTLASAAVSAAVSVIKEFYAKAATATALVQKVALHSEQRHRFDAWGVFKRTMLALCAVCNPRREAHSFQQWHSIKTRIH
eukprot:5596525-Amphidinium_carterae.1